MGLALLYSILALLAADATGRSSVDDVIRVPFPGRAS